jgi:hypothetical protein
MQPVPVHLITGLAGAGKSTLLRGWLATRPEGERWAVLVDGLPDSLGVGTDIASSTASSTAMTDAMTDTAGVTVVGLMGGCACCVGGPAFGVAVNSLLRQGPWDRLFIEVSAAANGAALVDRLRSEPLASRLRVQPVTLVVNLETASPYLDETRSGYQHAQDRLALARCVVLNRPSDSPVRAALAAHLSGAPPWPRALIRTADGTVPWDAIQAAHDAVLAGPKGACILQWAPEVCFDRRRLRALLDAAVAPGGAWQMAGLREAQGVFRTERAWYAWRSDGRAIAWRETDWRLESRLLVLADRAPDPHNERMRLASAIAVAAEEA